MSAPAANARPSPVTTTARAPASRATSAMRASSASSIAASSALSACGRSSVSSAPRRAARARRVHRTHDIADRHVCCAAASRRSPCIRRAYPSSRSLFAPRSRPAVRGHAAADPSSARCPSFSFRLFLLGGALGLLALLFGLIALYTTRRATGPRGPRARVGRVIGLGVAVIVGIAVAARSGAACRRSTTSPPTRAIRRSSWRSRARPNAGRDMSYPAEEFASQQRAGYPDLAPIAFAGPPDRGVRGGEDGGRELRLEDRRGGRGRRHDRGDRHLADLPLRRRHRRARPAAGRAARASTCARSRASAGATSARTRRGSGGCATR